MMSHIQTFMTYYILIYIMSMYLLITSKNSQLNIIYTSIIFQIFQQVQLLTSNCMSSKGTEFAKV